MKIPMNTTFPTLCATLLALAAGPALAHITLEQPEAVAGSAYKAVLRVGHGCDGSPTTRITVLLPEGLRGAHPSPKPGWLLETRKAPLAQPYESHGRRITEDVVEVRWTARSEEHWLRDEWYDEFVLRGQLPAMSAPTAAPAALWFKVRQDCAQGQWDWAQVPEAGVSTQGLKAPAVRLLLRAAPGDGGHAH